jgi:EmrB/QacA subfamily drug resistance transporter
VSEQQGQGQRQPASGQHLGVTFALLGSGIFAFALMQTLVGPALPDIQEQLHTSVSSVSWVITAYLLSASVATPLIGRLGDRYGKVRCFVLLLVLLAVSSLIAAFATSLAVMLVARVIGGVAGAVFPLASGIARDEFPRERIAGTIGLLSAMGAIAGGAGVVLAGPIIDALTLKGMFLVPAIPLVVAAVGIAVLIPESPVRAQGQINWTAAALMSAGLAAVLLAVSEASSWGWGAAKTLGLLAAGVALLSIWVRAETRSRQPLVDMRMMRIRGVWTTNVVAFTLGIGLYTGFILLPEFVSTPAQQGYGFGASVSQAGLFLLPMTTATVVVSVLTGRLERRFGSKRPMFVGIAVAAASYAMYAFLHDQEWQLYLAGVLLGAGTGLPLAAIVNVLIASVDRTQTGVATGMNTVGRTVGGAFGGALVASVPGSHVTADGFATEAGFTLAFAMCGIALAIGALVCLIVPEDRRSSAVTPAPVPEPAGA